MRLTRYEGNEIIKTEDQQDEQQLTLENFDILMRKCIDTLIVSGLQGSETATPSMSVDVVAGSVWDSTLKQYILSEEDFTVNIDTADPTLTRYDTVQVKREIIDYDAKIRNFKSASTGSITASTIDTKQQYTMTAEVKTGSPGGSAPSVDTGYVKIMEIEVPSSAVAIYDANIKNVTAIRPGDLNTNWTTDQGVTIFGGSPGDVNNLIQAIYEDAVTLNGIKTFGSIPVLPASNPTTNNQATRKAYVDSDGGGSSVSPTATGSIDLSSYLSGLNVFPAHSSNITLTFSNAVNSGRKLFLYNPQSDYFDAVVGGNTYRLYQYDSLLFISDGSNMDLIRGSVNSLALTTTQTVNLNHFTSELNIIPGHSSNITLTFSNYLAAGRRLFLYNGQSSYYDAVIGGNTYRLYQGDSAVFISDGSAMNLVSHYTRNVLTITATGSYTIMPGIGQTIIIDSSVSSQITLTISKGTGCTIADRVKIIDKSSYSGYHIITDGTTPYWLEQTKTVDYFFDGTDLMRGPGMQLIYDVPGNNANVDESALLEPTIDGAYYELAVSDASGYRLTGKGYINKSTLNSRLDTFNTSYVTWSEGDSGGTDQFVPSSGTHDIKKIWRRVE